MRIFKPTTAAIAAAALALAPAGAYAIRGAGRHAGRRLASSSAGCKLTINAAPRFVENGESALVFGQLTCRSGSVANQTVTVTERPAWAPASTAGTATTDAAGNYQVTSPALSTNTGFYCERAWGASAERIVRVSPKVTLAGPPDGAELFTGGGPILAKHVAAYRNRITFTGTVSPADAGAIVALQREKRAAATDGTGSAWVGRGRAARFSIVHTFRLPRRREHPRGRGPVQALTNAINAVGASEPLSYEISQAQNPALTIVSSAEPVSDRSAGDDQRDARGSVRRGADAVGAPAPRASIRGGRQSHEHDRRRLRVRRRRRRCRAPSTRSPAPARPRRRCIEGVRDVLERQSRRQHGPGGPAADVHGHRQPGASRATSSIWRSRTRSASASTSSRSAPRAPRAASRSCTARSSRASSSSGSRCPGDPEYEGTASPLLTVEVTPAAGRRADTGATEQQLAALRRPDSRAATGRAPELLGVCCGRLRGWPQGLGGDRRPPQVRWPQSGLRPRPRGPAGARRPCA